MVKCAKLYKGIICGSLSRFKTWRGTGFKSRSSHLIFTDSQSLQGCHHCQWSLQKQFKRKNSSQPINESQIFCNELWTYSQAYYWVAGTQMPRTYRGLHCVNKWVLGKVAESQFHHTTAGSAVKTRLKERPEADRREVLSLLLSPPVIISPHEKSSVLGG